MNDRLYKDYVARTGNKNPLGWLAEGHNAVYAYKAVIEKAKSTETAAVIAALKGLTWDSATGPRTMRGEDNQALYTIQQIRVAPAQNSDGWEVTEIKKYPSKDVIELPSPGKPLDLKSS